MRRSRSRSTRADGLDHLDRHDRVVLALDVAVVAELDVDAVLEPGRADPLARQLLLRGRDRDRRHPAPRSPAAWSAKPPQPDPISRTCMPGVQARSAITRYLLRWASARV